MSINQKEHGKRVLTAVIGVTLIGTLYYYISDWAVIATATIIGLCAFYEYLHMMLSKQNTQQMRTGKVCIGMACAGIFLLPGVDSAVMTIMLMLGFYLGIYFLYDKDSNLQELRYHFEDMFTSAFGLFYIVGFLLFLPMIHDFTNGLGWLLGLLFIIWGGDSIAYYGGSRFGRHRLAPSISPKKSWEGAGFGILGSIIGFFAVRYFMDLTIGIISGIVLASATGAISQLGDLFESALKRTCGVKDSGKMLPGHGGMFDRFDSLILAAPLYFYFVSLWIA